MNKKKMIYEAPTMELIPMDNAGLCVGSYEYELPIFNIGDEETELY